MDSLKKIKLTAGLSATLLLGGGAAVRDVTVLDIAPIERVEIIAGERVEAKQIENVVEATFPWKDQPGIKVKYDMGEPTLEEKASDVRKKQVYFEPKGETFEYGIVLSEVPESNTFCYEMEDAENYDWFKQPPLTDVEIAEGAFRPENVVNSYAVYHKVLKNHIVGKTNYETGKAFHRYRPQAVDANGETSWGDSNFVNNQICDTFDSTWLEGAQYPVKI